MNNPSLEKFAASVRPGGVVIINTSLVNVEYTREDVTVVPIAANDIAIELGSGKAANMVVLGAYVGATDAVSIENLKAFMQKKFANKPQFVDLNMEALQAGYDRAKAAMQEAK
jgi:2-oxoglutarate ferredoxin oxidoreductase subunit gamma